jgi:hypothetical protein
MSLAPSTLLRTATRFEAWHGGCLMGTAMPLEPDGQDEGTREEVIYRFSVQRGMTVALVIETPDWYSGLLHAALARVRIEGQN